MKRIALPPQKNIHLLKEYIKTLIATEAVFPGIMPRRWGNEFCRSELTAIYFGLKFVIHKANPHSDRDMINAFDLIEESESMTLHWFLCDYWEKLIPLTTVYPNLSDSYLYNLN